MNLPEIPSAVDSTTLAEAAPDLLQIVLALEWAAGDEIALARGGNQCPLCHAHRPWRHVRFGAQGDHLSDCPIRSMKERLGVP
jgi:hypothetical protein